LRRVKKRGRESEFGLKFTVESEDEINEIAIGATKYKFASNELILSGL